MGQCTLQHYLFTSLLLPPIELSCTCLHLHQIHMMLKDFNYAFGPGPIRKESYLATVKNTTFTLDEMRGREMALSREHALDFAIFIV